MGPVKTASLPQTLPRARIVSHCQETSPGTAAIRFQISNQSMELSSAESMKQGKFFTLGFPILKPTMSTPPEPVPRSSLAEKTMASMKNNPAGQPLVRGGQPLVTADKTDTGRPWSTP